MPSNSNNSRKLSVTETSNNLIQIAPVNPDDTSHLTYHARKRYTDAEHLSKVKIVLSSCIGDINFMDPVNTRKEHEELMNQVRNGAICIINKYKVQIEPLHFEWDRFIPPLEKEFSNILNEMPSCSSQQQPIKLKWKQTHNE